MSAVHVAFEINPATQLVVLSVRSKRLSSVRFAISDSRDKKKLDKAALGEPISGDGVIAYSQNYEIAIASYHFELLWPSNRSQEVLKAFVFQGYQTSLQQLQDVRSRDRPTENDNSEALSWHITRLNTARGPCFKDIPSLREFKGAGSFGTVFQAVDQTSGHNFAIKVVKLEDYGDIETARALLHREIKVMERLHHVSDKTNPDGPC